MSINDAFSDRFRGGEGLKQNPQEYMLIAKKKKDQLPILWKWRKEVMFICFKMQEQRRLLSSCFTGSVRGTQGGRYSSCRSNTPGDFLKTDKAVSHVSIQH